MKNFKSLAMFALILPIGAFASSAALAQSQPGSSAAQQSQPSAEQQSAPGSSSDRPAGAQGSSPDRASSALGSSADRQSSARDSASDTGREMARTTSAPSYMSTTPVGATRVDEVIGSELRMRSNDEEIGTIDDLIIDESGQVVAVVVSVGGFLGMGQHPVAISWDSVERALNDDSDGYVFNVNVTEDTLRDAPAYDKDSTGIHATTSTTTN